MFSPKESKSSSPVEQEKQTSSRAKSLPAVAPYQSDTVQRAGMEEEEPLQGKFEPIQKMEEEEPMQGKFETVQKAGIEEEEPIQGKFETVQRYTAEEEVEEEAGIQAKFKNVVQKAGMEEEPLQRKFANPVQLQKNNTGLPDSLKSGVESLSGVSLNDVKVHYNSSKPATLQAHAYAQGTDIHIAPGQEKHLPHEAWHTVQQKQGRVKPTLQMKQGVPVNDDAGLENEADQMGAKALEAGKDSFAQHS